MFARMIAKEWKERLGLFVFGLLGLLAFILSFFIYSQNEEVVDILAGTVILIFLPVFSLLLGATGFSSEFRDDAWAYLFSRPVQKWQIWITKYVSLLSILIVVLVIFALLADVHPALRSAREALRIPLRFGEDIPFWILAYVLPLFLFTIAFSFSVLSEKSHVVVFLSGLTAFFLQTALTIGVSLLVFEFWWFPRLGLRFVMSFLFLLSFVAASVLTLSRGDFSQPGRRAWVFTKFAAFFLVLSLGAGAILTFASMKMRKIPYISSPEIRSGTAYFTTDRGIFRIDLSSGQKQWMAGIPSRWGDVHAGGDKITFWKYTFKGKLRAFEELWIMNVDGKKAKPLVQTSEEDSPLFDASFYPIFMSPSGDKVAFVARWGRKKITRNLWCINTDGTGMKGYAVDLSKDGFSRILGFIDSNRYLLIADIPRGRAAWEEGSKLLIVNLENGEVETLAEHTHDARLQPSAGLNSSPYLVAYVHFERGHRSSTLFLLDARTLEQRELYEGESITGFRWNQAGDKLAFVAAQTTLGIYSLAENKITQIKDLPGYDFRWPSYFLDWVSG
ncbi:MAG: ABC transporter permease, partial [Acidobacteriota bacterium]